MRCFSASLPVRSIKVTGHKVILNPERKSTRDEEIRDGEADNEEDSDVEKSRAQSAGLILAL